MTIGLKGIAGFVGSGSVAGAASALVFTVIHQVLINPIWTFLPIMLLAGALCGASVAWSYALLVPIPTIPSWMKYNGFFLLMFVALGITSLIAFEPVTTIAALLQSKEPPRALIGRALPVTALFALGSTVLLSVLYHPAWQGVLAALVTTAVLVLLLGLNISILGLVEVPRAAMGVLLEVLLLLLALVGVYATLVVAAGKSRFRKTRGA